MGLSTRQFTELMLLLILVYSIAFLSAFIANRYHPLWGVITMIIPFSFILVYSAWVTERRIYKKNKGGK